MYSDQIAIPQGLLSDNNLDEDINILIGENGSGKSTLLNAIARHYIFNTRRKVIALANTIHDKFNFKNPRFEILRASTGKTIAKKTLKSALKLLVENDNKRQSSIAIALRYVNFDPVVGIRVKGIKRNFEQIIDNDAQLTEKAKSDISYCLSRFLRETPYSNDIHRINLHHSDFYDLRDSFLITILIYEKEIKSLKLISDIEVFLFRDRQILPLNSASSGELTLITSLLYIVSSISSHAVILIDEPENSLHPKWQTEYVKLLIDHFYRYEPKIIIATHSPLIINAAEITSSGVTVYKGSNGQFASQFSDSQNVEEIYQDFFNVTTPENRYLSQEIVKLMNLLAAGQIDIVRFELEINDFRRSSYSDDQKEVLDGILEMGQKIIESRT
ncbi:ATP-binding protein [Pedobacter sp. MC2016-05]|uniref:AAA family ATPase n=1 Tax=Pedobacter sp. MC2016-05 TaxID=2994474 RepID=UPI002247D27C|nr:ATP-binding protein [Pedobacter sp. MC2016-05]MCX2474642.1 ATP-binding protein [Pedobacter sp. MC2016-05]